MSYIHVWKMLWEASYVPCDVNAASARGLGAKGVAIVDISITFLGRKFIIYERTECTKAFEDTQVYLYTF